MFTVQPLGAADADDWLSMRRAMGPEWLVQSMPGLAAEYLSQGTVQGLPHVVLIARDARGHAVGFAEVSRREFAEGCLTSPVGYLEGWFVKPQARGRGVGAALVKAGEAWAAEHGCAEFASDAELDNDVSLRAHAALGFEPVADIRCFRKAITPPEHPDCAR